MALAQLALTSAALQHAKDAGSGITTMLVRDTSPNPSTCYLTSNAAQMVDSVWIQKVKQAVELAHGGRADYLYAVPVHDKRDGTTFWFGRVYVFDLQQGDSVKTLYAWFEVLDTGPARFYTALGSERIDSPAAAIRLTMNPGP